MPKKAFEDNAMSRTQAFKWYSFFKSGGTLFEGLEPSDDPSSRQTDKSLEKMHGLVTLRWHNHIASQFSSMGESRPAARVANHGVLQQRILVVFYPKGVVLQVHEEQLLLQTCVC